MTLGADNARIGADLIHRWPTDLSLATCHLQTASGCINADRSAFNAALVGTDPSDLDLTQLHLLADELDKAAQDAAEIASACCQVFNGRRDMDVTRLGLIARNAAERLGLLQQRVAAFRFGSGPITDTIINDHTTNEECCCHV